jgi:hypothetical protein
MHEDGFTDEIEADPPEHRVTVEGSESVMGSSGVCNLILLHFLIWGWLTGLQCTWLSICASEARVFMISCSCPFFRMDSSSALRIAMRVPGYYEACDDGRNVAHNAADFQLIVDRDTLNLIDLSKDVAAKVSNGKNQSFIWHISTRTPNAIPI